MKKWPHYTVVIDYHPYFNLWLKFFLVTFYGTIKIGHRKDVYRKSEPGVVGGLVQLVAKPRCSRQLRRWEWQNMEYIVSKFGQKDSVTRRLYDEFVEKGIGDD